MKKLFNRIQLFSILILSLWVIACTADPHNTQSELTIQQIIRGV